MVRWDHLFSENDKFHAVYTYQKGYEYRDSTGFGKPAAQGNTNNERRDINLILSWTHILSPTSVLDVRGSFRVLALGLLHDCLGFSRRLFPPLALLLP